MAIETLSYEDCMERLELLCTLLATSDKARQRRIEYEQRMSQIDATSPENEYQEKLKYLAANGKGGEMKAMIEEREKV